MFEGRCTVPDIPFLRDEHFVINGVFFFFSAGRNLYIRIELIIDEHIPSVWPGLGEPVIIENRGTPNRSIFELTIPLFTLNGGRMMELNAGFYRFSIHTEDLHHYMENLCLHSVLILDSDNLLKNCNTLLLKTTGFTMEELANGPLSETLGDELEDRIVRWRLERKDGSGVGNASGTLLVQDKAGERHLSRYLIAGTEWEECPGYTTIHLYDIHPERDLGVPQQFTDALIRDINLGVILFDTSSRLIDISDMACRVLGFSRQDAMNRSMDDIFASVPLEHRLILRRIFDGKAVRNHAISWTNGLERYELLLDSNLLKDHAGNTVGGYVTFKDVTNLRSLEEQVQRSDRLAMIGQIAAGTAHEIRNPLTSIKGFLQVLRNKFIVSGMEKEKSYTDIMLIEIDRINELVSEFLLLSKRKNVSFELVDVPTILKEILPIIENEAILHGIAVDYEESGDLPPVIADRELLKQVFLNIGKNGIEAMGEGGQLSFSAKADREERLLLVDIRDTGPGIPGHAIGQIFDPFFTTKTDGTGLGLSVCQRIVHDMGGSIRVSSGSGGTSFTVGIPLP